MSGWLVMFAMLQGLCRVWVSTARSMTMHGSAGVG